MNTNGKERGKMSRNNTIGIVGRITTPPQLVLDAKDWERRVYETTLTRTRPSGKEDTFILQFSGRAAYEEKAIEKLTVGTEVLVGGEIKTENVRDPRPEENRVKVYIHAEIIAINDPPAKNQNQVKICGYLCKAPKFKEAQRRASKRRQVETASIIVAVNSLTGPNYIPCVCFGWEALAASTLKIGDYVEIYGRFQSRERKKRVEGRKPPYLCTVYEVCTVRLKSDSAKHMRKGKAKKEDKRHEKANTQGSTGQPEP